MQDLPRLHTPADPSAPLADGAILPMTPAQAHYLGSVLRREPGAGVTLFNAADGEWDGRIVSLRKDRGSIAVQRRLRPPAPEPGPHLLFAPLKRDATDLVVRMATELGAASIGAVLTERTNTARINRERWTAIATEAAEQCERLSIPRIDEPIALPDLLGGWDRSVPLLVGLERPRQDGPGGADPRIAPGAWRSAAAPETQGTQPGAMVGPEGGWSPAEHRMLAQAGFVVPVRLGPRVLRAETAAAALLAMLLG